MAFKRKEWKDGEAGNTPVTADELNRMEQGIEDASKTGGVEVGAVFGWTGEGILEGYDVKKMGYSTEEMLTGKTWTNGKPTYIKTIIATLPDAENTSITVGTNIENFIDVYGFIDLGSRTPINAYWTENLKSITQQNQSDANKLNIYYGSAFKGCTFKITVEYTKTTDTGNFKYIEKKSVTPIDPKTGHIFDTTNIDNKAENTYSANVIDELVNDDGYVMGQEYTCRVVLSTKPYYGSYRGVVPLVNAHKYNITMTGFDGCTNYETTNILSTSDTSAISTTRTINGFAVGNTNSNFAGAICNIKFTLSKI